MQRNKVRKGIVVWWNNFRIIRQDQQGQTVKNCPGIVTDVDKTHMTVLSFDDMHEWTSPLNSTESDNMINVIEECTWQDAHEYFEAQKHTLEIDLNMAKAKYEVAMTDVVNKYTKVLATYVRLGGNPTISIVGMATILFPEGMDYSLQTGFRHGETIPEKTMFDVARRVVSNGFNFTVHTNAAGQKTLVVYKNEFKMDAQ